MMIRLDAFGVHGAGGTLGALLTGVFAVKAINPIFKNAQGTATAVGLIDGHPAQVLNQLWESLSRGCWPWWERW